MPSELTWEDDLGNLQYDKYGDLLVNTQDTCYRYARVHLRRMVSDPIWTRIAKQEHHYRANPDELETYHNGRMPWAEYRSLVLKHLPGATGMSTLNYLLTFPREEGWKVIEWV